MKKLLLLNLTLLASGLCYAMEQGFDNGKEGEKEEYEQPEERKIPTLKELAAQEAVKSTDISDKNFASLPFEAKESIMQQSTSLPDIMHFIDSIKKTGGPLLSAIQESMGRVTPAREHIDKNLLKKIPPLLFNAILNSEIKFSDFMEWITHLPTDIRQSIIAVFADQIHKYMTRDTINFLRFMIAGIGTQHHLPIEFEELIFKDELESKLPIILSPEFLVPIFIMQQLQLLLIDTFKNSDRVQYYLAYNEPLLIYNGSLLDAQLQKKINNVLSQMEQYINSHEYSTLKIYFKRLHKIFSNIHNIKGLSFTSYIWDEKERAHKEK